MKMKRMTPEIVARIRVGVEAAIADHKRGYLEAAVPAWTSDKLSYRAWDRTFMGLVQRQLFAHLDRMSSKIEAAVAQFGDGMLTPDAARDRAEVLDTEPASPLEKPVKPRKPVTPKEKK